MKNGSLMVLSSANKCKKVQHAILGKKVGGQCPLPDFDITAVQPLDYFGYIPWIL